MLNKLISSRSCKWPVYTVAVSQDASMYLWGGGSPGAECSVRVDRVSTEKPLHTLKEHKKPVVRARFLEDGSIVSFSFDSQICVWTPEGKLASSNKRSLDHRAHGFSVSRDANLAVVGDYRGEISGWSLRDGGQTFAFNENGQRRQIWSLALAPDEKRFASGGAGGVIRIWETAQQRRQAEIDLGLGNHVRGLAWHPNRGILAAAIDPDGAAADESKSRVVLFDGATAKELTSLYPDDHQLACCDFAPDGRLIAAAGGGENRGASESIDNCIIHVWDVTSGKKVAKLRGHTSTVRDLAFAPDSSWLLSAGWDSTVRSWDLRSVAEIGSPPYHPQS